MAGGRDGRKAVACRLQFSSEREQGLVPEPGTVTPETEDALAYAQDLQRERCVLFVACTRARDHLYVSGTGEPSSFLPPGTVERPPAPVSAPAPAAAPAKPAPAAKAAAPSAKPTAAKPSAKPAAPRK